MRQLILIGLLAFLVLASGCAQTDIDGDDYGDAPSEIQDGGLDYQDYKESDCPYLNGSLDQETMEKCNEWIRENRTGNTTETISPSQRD